MNWPAWLRNTYWGLLTLTVGVLLFYFPSVIKIGEGSTTQIITFVLFLALVLAPLFQQISLFGLRLSKKIDNVQKELSDQINEVKNQVDVQASANSQQIVGISSYKQQTDERLDEIADQVDLLLRSYGVEDGLEETEVDVPDQATYLFQVRYNLEQRVEKLFAAVTEEEKEQKYIPVQRKLDRLVQTEMMAPEVINAIREVWKICSRGVHGDEVRESELRFVRHTAPELMSSLDNVIEDASIM